MPARMFLEPERMKLEIRERYDRLTERELFSQAPYETITPAKAYFRSRKLRAALKLGTFRPGGHLLEIGSSVGIFSLPLARMGFRLTGVDLSENSLAVASRRAREEGLGNVSFLAADAERLDRFGDGTFDGVVSFSTLRYVPDLPKALSEIGRVLKPQARAVVDFPNRLCPWFYLKSWLGSERHPHDHWFTRRRLEGLLHGAGFQDCRFQHLLFTPTILPEPLLWIFQGIDWCGERIPLVRNCAGILLVSAQKP